MTIDKTRLRLRVKIPSLTKTDLIILSLILIVLSFHSLFFLIPGWRATKDVWPVPTDDSYIHAQYARNLGRGRLFVWSPGDGYSKGLTGIVYPFLLFPGFILGIQDHWIMAYAFILNLLVTFLGVFFLYKLFREFLPLLPSVFGISLWLFNGFMIYSVFSGMDAALAAALVCVLLWFFWRIIHRKSAMRDICGFVTAATLLVHVRPESTLLVGILTLSVLFYHRREWKWKKFALLCIPFVSLIILFSLNYVMTGNPFPNSFDLKGVWSNPSLMRFQKIFVYKRNLRDFPGKLSKRFFGSFSFPGLIILFVSVVGLVRIRKERVLRAFLVPLIVGFIAMILFLCGQKGILEDPVVRLFRPYYILLLVLVTVGAFSFKLPRISYGIGFFFIGILLVFMCLRIPFVQDHFIEESKKLSRKQVFLARRIREMNRETPGACKRILTHDAGAPIYFSQVKGFDAMGLCTNLRAYPALSQCALEDISLPFEAIERFIPSKDLPDYSLVFKAWSNACYAGELVCDPADYFPDIHEDSKQNMKIYRFPKERVGSGHFLPIRFYPKGWRLVDQLDVADYISEKEHDFHLYWKEEEKMNYVDVIFNPDENTVDVARGFKARAEFRLYNLVQKQPLQLFARIKTHTECILFSQIGEYDQVIIAPPQIPHDIVLVIKTPKIEQDRIKVSLTPQQGVLFIGYVWALQPGFK